MVSRGRNFSVIVIWAQSAGEPSIPQLKGILAVLVDSKIDESAHRGEANGKKRGMEMPKLPGREEARFVQEHDSPAPIDRLCGWLGLLAGHGDRVLDDRGCVLSYRLMSVNNHTRGEASCQGKEREGK